MSIGRGKFTSPKLLALISENGQVVNPSGILALVVAMEKIEVEVKRSRGIQDADQLACLLAVIGGTAEQALRRAGVRT